MVTFTLPFELRVLARRQPKALYQLMFRVSASILKDFATRQGLGNIGFTSVLHTHSRRRELHPHLHIVVPNGGYNPTRKQWRKGKKKAICLTHLHWLKSGERVCLRRLSNTQPCLWITWIKCLRHGWLIVKKSWPGVTCVKVLVSVFISWGVAWQRHYCVWRTVGDFSI